MFSPRLNETAPDGTSFDLKGPQEAPVLCLIHGLGLSRELWTEFLPHFTRSFRVLNYDLYGHGLSGLSPETLSLKVYSEQLAGLLEYLDIAKASVIGFSIGGMINRRFAMDHSDRLDTLVILNSPHDRGDEAQKLVEARAASVRNEGTFSTFDSALKRWFTPKFLETDIGAKKVRDWREQVDGESYAQAAWVLANGVRELIAPANPIRARTLVMTCENDSGSTPKMSEDIAAEIESSELHIVPKLQHLGLMEQPTLFVTPMMEFLERHEK